MKKLTYLSLSLITLIFHSSWAQVPQKINYQGYLVENDIPVITQRTISLTIKSGTTNKYSESFNVTPVKGLFTVTLGGSGTPVPNDIWGKPLTVKISIAGDTVVTEPLTTVPYSFIASHVDNAHIQDLEDGALDGTRVNPNFGSQNIITGGTVTAASFTGSGAGLTLLTVESSEIDDGTIVNADINASAAIADTKLATISTAGKVSGSAITSGTIAGSTAINTTGSITANSFTGSGAGLTSLAVAGSEIDDGTITNADINASAAIVDTKLATINTSGKVSNSATTAVSTNTANAIVVRDASGNFSAGTITASLNGNASTVTTNANLTGDITSSGNATAISAGVIVDADINSGAAIADTKLGTISTAGKVSGSAITSGAIGGSTSMNTSGSLVSSSYMSATSGVHVGSTTAPSAGNLEVDGYAKLGGTGITVTTSSPVGAVVAWPSIRVLKVTGTCAAADGTATVTLSGLAEAKILSVVVMVEYTTGDYVHAGYTNTGGLQFNYFYQNNILSVKNITGNSASLAGRPFKAIITYEE